MEVIANKTYFIHTWNYITEKREIIIDDIETLEEGWKTFRKSKRKYEKCSLLWNIFYQYKVWNRWTYIY